MAFNELIKSFDNIRHFMSLALRAELILRIKALAAMTTSADALKAGWGSICISARMPAARTALFPWTAEKSGIILFIRR